MNKNFVESFVRECYNQGLTEKQACAALEITMQKSAAATRTEYGDAYGDLNNLGARLANVETTQGEPTYAEQPQWTNITDWPGLIWDGLESGAGALANWFIPGIYREEARVHDPYTSRAYVSDYTKGFRRNWDAARAASAAKLARIRDEYGTDDPRYKEFDPARATMEYMYNPIRNRRQHHIDEYNKARGVLENELARAEKYGATSRIASIKGQIAELDKQHAANMADSDREDAEFRAMVGGTSGVGGQTPSSKHNVASTLNSQIEANQRDLDRINDDLAYANSGFFNRWINPFTADWGRAIATTDTSQLEKNRQYLINQNVDLRQREREVADMQEAVSKHGWTPELADAVMKGGPSMSQQLEEKAKAVEAEKAKKKAELAKTQAAKSDFGKAMVGFADPKQPVKAKSPVNNAAMAKVHEMVNAPKPTKPAAPAPKTAPAAPAKPAPVKKPVAAPKLKKKEPLPVA
jgi:hypothetical protein